MPDEPPGGYRRVREMLSSTRMGVGRHGGACQRLSHAWLLTIMNEDKEIRQRNLYYVDGLGPDGGIGDSLRGS